MQQITKAMKMVSAAKLRRAQDRATGLAALFEKSWGGFLSNIAAGLPAGSQGTSRELPLLAVREEKRIQLIVVSSGPLAWPALLQFKSAALAQKFIEEHRQAELRIETIGRKSRRLFPSAKMSH